MTTVDPASGPADVRLRPAERGDLLAIHRIERLSFPQPWPYRVFESFLGEPGFLVAEGAGRTILGYAVGDVVPNHGRGVGHVKDLAVHPDHRGRGVGSRLLAELLGVLSRRGARSITLEVRASNEPAIELYRAFGFEPLRRVQGYYDDGEDAVVMIRELGS